MNAQASRLLGVRGGGHGQRGGEQREELIAAHGYDTEYAMHAARFGFQGVGAANHSTPLPAVGGEPADWLRAVRRGDVSFRDW
jgi:hypothetical protein